MYLWFSQIKPKLTVGSHGDEGGRTEEQDEEDVAAEQEPPQRGQVVEPRGRVRVQGLVKEHFKIGLTPKRPDGP